MTITVTCVSDMHGDHPELPGGDLLILAGDHTANDNVQGWARYYAWLKAQKYDKKVMIAGNHDNFLMNCCASFEARQLGLDEEDLTEDFEYLCDSGIEYRGLKIWGAPWTRNFRGQSRCAMAFGLETEAEMREKWDLIPSDTNILITHSPPNDILDKTSRKRVGCLALKDKLLDLPQLQLHVFGHIHEGYGITHRAWEEIDGKICGLGPLFVNAAHMDGSYEAVNEPWTFELELPKVSDE